MTRFRELKRIERAIEHKNERELQWALGYCKTRLRLASLKDHRKGWKKVESKVLQALADSK